MITRRGTKTGITSRGTKNPLDDFAVSLVARERVISGGAQTVSRDKDTDVNNYSPATVAYECDAGLDPGLIGGLEVDWYSSNTAVATIDANGVMTRVADGEARARAVNTRGRANVSAQHSFVQLDNVVTTNLNSWTDDSLAHANSSAIDGEIASGDPATKKPMYSNGNTRNQNCWAAALADLSCIDREKPGAVFLGNSGGFAYGIQVEHFKDIEDTFVAMDGTVATVSVTNRIDIGPSNSSDSYATDISIVRYSAALDSKFVPAMLLPSDVMDRLPGLSWGLPVLVTDQEKKALVAEWRATDTKVRMQVPSDSNRVAYYEPIIVGDSGSPAFLFLPVIGHTHSHRLALVTSWTSGGAGVGPVIHNYLADIQAAMSSMGGSPADLSVADLSEHPTDLVAGWTGKRAITNLLLNADNLSDASWVRTAATIGTGVGPHGGPCQTITVNGNNSLVTKDMSSYPSDRTLRSGVWLKGSSPQTVGLRVPIGTNYTSETCNVTTGWQYFETANTVNPANSNPRFLLDFRTPYSPGIGFVLSVWQPETYEV